MCDASSIGVGGELLSSDERGIGIIPVVMRKTLPVVTWGIFPLFNVDHAFAEHFSLSFSKFC